MEEHPRERVECALCSRPAVVEAPDGLAYCAEHYARVYRFRVHIRELGSALSVGVIHRRPARSPRVDRTRRRHPRRA